MKALNKLAKFLFVSVLVFWLAPLNAATSSFIIDTDAGLDDIIAISYILNRPDISVKAITITGNGLTSCESGFRIISGLLSLKKKTTIPVACGPDKPLRGNHHYPQRLIDRSNNFEGAAKLLPSTNNPVDHNAVNLLLNTIAHSEQPVTILAIAPLTNIALALQRQPAIIKNIRMIYFMGGAINVAGNLTNTIPQIKNKTAEWNVYLDPAAAEIVFTSHVPLALIPLDVTNQVPMDWAFYQKIKQHHSTRTATIIYEILKRKENILLAKKWYFWDPLAAVVATNQALATWKNMPLEVQLEPEFRSGSLIVNKKNGNTVRVCAEVNKRYFKNLLLNTIN